MCGYELIDYFYLNNSVKTKMDSYTITYFNGLKDDERYGNYTGMSCAYYSSAESEEAKKVWAWHIPGGVKTSQLIAAKMDVPGSEYIISKDDDDSSSDDSSEDVPPVDDSSSDDSSEDTPTVDDSSEDTTTTEEAPSSTEETTTEDDTKSQGVVE